MGVTYLGEDSGVDIETLVLWGDFTALNGKTLNGKAGYTNLGAAEEIALVDSGDYVFYVTYADGAKNGIRFVLITVEAEKAAPEYSVSGNEAILNANDNTVVQSGVTFVGSISDEAFAQINTWGAFDALAKTGKTLAGKVGYTILSGNEVTLPENGDYVFYVIYKDANGVTKTVYIKQTVNVEEKIPAITVTGNVASLEANGVEIVQSGVTFVGSISDDAVAQINTWGAFGTLAKTGKTLAGKIGYTILSGNEVTLPENGDYVFYVIYKVNGLTKTVYIKQTVEGQKDKPTIAVDSDGKVIVENNNFTVVQAGATYVGENSGVEATEITSWGAFTALNGKALNGKTGYTILRGDEVLSNSGDYIFYVIYKDVNGATKTAYYKVEA